MNLKPLSNHIFLETIEEEKITKSGIVLPETSEKEKPIKGKIIAVGPGKKNDKGEIIQMSVKVGDIVLFKKYGPDEIEIEDKKYLVGDEDDILAILE
ncbi:co-chaperone GroES [Candidatus Wolfebacteria bacterium]|nr:co-chaperone GroES [Candidatus Wolfebacteria bacterium]